MNALDLTCGAELERFEPREIPLNGTTYTVLTGYETERGICFWCGGELKGKAKRYCRGHMTEYYNHFNWQYASYEARKRAGYRCENCGVEERGGRIGWRIVMTNLEVHHIVPLKGEPRFFSAFNLPWNLIVFCHECHQLIHAIMRGDNHKPSRPVVTKFDLEVAAGQGVLI